MGEPQGRNGTTPIQPLISYDKSKTLNIKNPGPKFLIMSRISVNINETLENVSPFLIKKVIDSTCGGVVELCKKLRNGTVLIKTKNITQASALIQLGSLSPTIKVNVTEHTTLNYVKGVIYSNDLRNIPNEEILEELKQQGVIKIEKILKRVNTELCETGLIIVTFAALNLPGELFIGYERVSVRTYIPLPLRCNNCFMYGHVAKICREEKKCANCGEIHHTDSEKKEQCLNPKSCVNCISQKRDTFNHAAFDKACPIFIREKEIQSIITLEKVNKKTAVAIYNNRNQTNGPTYADTVKNSANIVNNSATLLSLTNIQKYMTQPKAQPTISKRPIADYSDFLGDTISSTCAPKVTKSKVTIVPRKTSKRLRSKLAAELTAHPKSNTGMNISETEASDSASVEIDVDMH